MSVGRYGRRGRQWKPASYARGYQGSGHPDAEDYADRMTKAAIAAAPALGFCPNCGGDIDEANGKKHHPDCVVPDERKCFHEWVTLRAEDVPPPPAIVIGAVGTFCKKCGRRKT